MPRIIVLDAGPLSLAAMPPGHPRGGPCRAWLLSRVADGDRVVAPDIADYEVRRELRRGGKAAALARLDILVAALERDPIRTEVLREAAELWALARNAGMPTADPKELDADAILAAHARLIGDPADVVVATTNVGHLARFVAAREWHAIA